MNEEINYQSYVSPTRFPLAIGIVLIIQMLRAGPKRADARVRRAQAQMREAAVEGQELAIQKIDAAPETVRPIDIRLDGGIVGLREVLEAKARLVGTKIAERASQLLAKIFPDGTGFVLLSLQEEWIAVQAHLARIDRLGLADEIDEVAGPEFLPFIRAAHEDLGEALGVGETALSATETARVRTSIQRMAKAIAAYGRAMVATVDEDDPESVAAFKRAMFPLDEYRRSAFGRGETSETEEPVVDPDVSPTDPIPPVPSDPVA